jgi:HAD superfamily hydrolase (TIGR01459 family)
MSVQSSSASVPALVGLSSVADKYDLIVCDVWGVVHNGQRAYPRASEALVRFRKKGGTVVLVSNAPRPADRVASMINRLGGDPAAWDDIVSSGDLTRMEVAARPGQAVFHIGPERDQPIYAGLDVRFVGPADAAYMVCTGFANDEVQTPEDYRAELEIAARRKLLMICANPDLVVERGPKLIPCAGAMAQFYETLGGAVLYAGKPHPPVYEETLRRAEKLRGTPVAKDRVLAIGDAIRTDVTGAAKMGFPCLFVARGIHAHELGLADGPLDPARLTAWAAKQQPRPWAVIETLAW